MFIMTEKHEIINLNYYARIKVDRNEIKASVKPTILGDKGDTSVSITVASFDESMDADYALHDLFKAIADGKPIWNVNTVTSLSSVWNTIRAEQGSVALMDRVKLSVSGLNEFTVTYPSYHKGTNDADKNIEIVKSELLKALGGDSAIIVRPEFAND